MDLCNSNIRIQTTTRRITINSLHRLLRLQTTIKVLQFCLLALRMLWSTLNLHIKRWTFSQLYCCLTGINQACINKLKIKLNTLVNWISSNITIERIDVYLSPSIYKRLRKLARNPSEEAWQHLDVIVILG